MGSTMTARAISTLAPTSLCFSAISIDQSYSNLAAVTRF
jgi:hypothetical protein